MVPLLVLVGLLGVAVGSFLAVVVRRVPAGLPVVTSSSRRGVPARYPVAEAVTAVLFVLVTWRAVQLDQAATVPALLAFTALGIALSAIDLAVRRLPDVLVLPAYPLLTGLLAVSAAVRHDWGSLGRAALGAAVLSACFLTMALVHPPGMGLGDVKLSGLIGLVLGWFSWPALAVGAFAGFFLGAVAGLGVMATSPLGRRATVPFGPFMVAGALLALWVPDPVAGVLAWG